MVQPPPQGKSTRLISGVSVFPSYLKKETNLQSSLLITQLRTAEASLFNSPLMDRLRTVVSIHDRIKAFDMSKVSKSMLWPRQKNANKPHSMLVHRLKPHPSFSIPVFLLQPNGAPTYCPRTMSKILGDFYHKFYKCLNSDSQFHFTQAKFDAFFASLQLPKVSPSNLSKLNMNIIAKEIEIVRHLPKSPKPDG